MVASDVMNLRYLNASRLMNFRNKYSNSKLYTKRKIFAELIYTPNVKSYQMIRTDREELIVIRFFYVDINEILLLFHVEVKILSICNNPSNVLIKLTKTPFYAQKNYLLDRTGGSATPFDGFGTPSLFLLRYVINEIWIRFPIVFVDI